MKTRYFVVTDNSFGPDPITGLADALKGLFYGVDTETGLVITIQNEDAQAIVERALQAADRDFVQLPVEEPEPVNLSPIASFSAALSSILSGASRAAREEVLAQPMEEALPEPEKEPAQLANLGASTLEGLVHVDLADLPSMPTVESPAPADTGTPLPLCEHCKQPFVRDRVKVRFCKREECQKDRQRQWLKKSAERKKASQAGSPAGDDGSPGAASEVVDEMIFDAPTEEADADTSSENRGGEQAAPRETKAWYVEDGPREGEWLSSHEMSVALQLGNFVPGQHVRHNKRGRHQIIKGKRGSKALKLRQLYGENAPRSVTL